MHIYADRVPSKFWCAAVCLNVAKLRWGIYTGTEENQINQSLEAKLDVGRTVFRGV
jgi:hypothetical protein